MQQMTMEPDLQFSVLCDDVRREDNGKFILLGLFEAVRSKQFPARHPSLFIVNRWCNGEGEFKQKTRIISPEDKIVAEDKKTSFVLKDISQNYTVIARFSSIVFPVPGRYWIEILLGDNLKQRYPIMLIESKPLERH
jgi:hypothetical protein